MLHNVLDLYINFIRWLAIERVLDIAFPDISPFCMRFSSLRYFVKLLCFRLQHMSSCTLALQIMTDTDSFTQDIMLEPGYLGRPDSGLSRWSDVCISIPTGRYNMTFHAVGCLGDRIQITDVTVGTRGCGKTLINYNL